MNNLLQPPSVGVEAMCLRFAARIEREASRFLDEAVRAAAPFEKDRPGYRVRTAAVRPHDAAVGWLRDAKHRRSGVGIGKEVVLAVTATRLVVLEYRGEPPRMTFYRVSAEWPLGSRDISVQGVEEGALWRRVVVRQEAGTTIHFDGNEGYLRNAADPVMTALRRARATWPTVFPSGP